MSILQHSDWAPLNPKSVGLYCSRRLFWVLYLGNSRFSYSCYRRVHPGIWLYANTHSLSHTQTHSRIHLPIPLAPNIIPWVLLSKKGKEGNLYYAKFIGNILFASRLCIRSKTRALSQVRNLPTY